MTRNSSSTTIIIMITALFLTLILMTSCSAKQAIVGSWDCDLTNMTFNKDGSMSSGMLGLGIEGTYEFVDSDTIFINQMGVSGEADVKISKGVLTMNDGLMTLTCTKAK